MKPFVCLLSTSLLAGMLAPDGVADPRGWRTFYTLEGAHPGEKLAQDRQGNVYVGGTVWQGDAGWGVSVVKYSSEGQRRWASVFDSDSPGETLAADNFRSFAVDAGQNVYVAVARFAPAASLVVFKLDPRGKVLWQQRGEAFPAELGLDAAGNCFVVGTLEANGVPGRGPQSFLAKFNPDGQKLWERYYVSSNWPNWGNPSSLAVDSAGNAFVVGFQYTISKFDGDGHQMWQKDYFGQAATRVITDSFGNAYVTGTRLEADTLTVKLDPSGNELWKSIYLQPEAQWTSPTDLVFDWHGNVYLSTFSEVGKVDLVKLNPDGTFAWRGKDSGIGGSFVGLAYLNNLAVDEQGRSWFLFTAADGANARDAVLSSYDPNGKLLGRTNLRTRRHADELPGDILLDRLGNPLVTFYGQPNKATASGWITAKLPQTRNLKPIWVPPRRN
jgi:hypothetical protein